MSKEKLAIQKMFVAHHIGEPAKFDKPVTYVLQGDGLWQVRKNEIGTFYVQQYDTIVPGLTNTLTSGFELNVPLIPLVALQSVIEFFRDVYDKHQSEAHIQILFDRKKKEYILHCPKQTVTSASVKYEYEDITRKSDNLLVLEIHSHGSMNAFFSSTDDKDEKSDRFFGVVGNITQYYPDIKLRLSIGDFKVNVDINDVFDVEDAIGYPKEWMKQVKKAKFIYKGKFPYAGQSSAGQSFFGIDNDDDDDASRMIKKHMSGDFLYPPEFCLPDEEDWMQYKKELEAKENKEFSETEWIRRR